MALKDKPMTAVRADIPLVAATQGDLVRINFLVPAETRLQWKKLALDNNKTLQQLIIDSMSQHCKTAMK